MLDDLSSEEFADWEAFCALELIGPERGDHQAAIVASILANINRDTKRRPNPFREIDFMPYRPNPEQSDSQAMVALDSFFRKMGGQ